MSHPPPLLPWDAEFQATRPGMERAMRALVCVRGHFTDSMTLAPVAKPTRAVTVFMRIWLRPGTEKVFMEMAGIDEIKPPPLVHVGMDRAPVDDGRRPMRREVKP